MIRYLITDGTAALDRARWLANIAAWLQRGIDAVQIREREMSARQLAEVTRAVMGLENPACAKILVNDRADVALACGADGVHLRDGSIAPEWLAGRGLTISVSCHKPSEAGLITGADFILLAPVFMPLSKEDYRTPLGLDALGEAAALTRTPILALGGVTESNAVSCIEAGAAGVAGISLFRGF